MDPDTETPASLELRFVEVAVRASANADGEAVRRIEGLAAPYQAQTRIRAWGGHEFEEALEPGVFGETLRSGADVRLLLEHDSRALLARTKAGNLRLRDTPRGLEFEADHPLRADGRDARALRRHRGRGARAGCRYCPPGTRRGAAARARPQPGAQPDPAARQHPAPC